MVTAAAMIMFSIFVAFMFTSDPTIKAIGFSFAAGVFLDAFVVRLTLVPAIMAIIGSKLWYHPPGSPGTSPTPTSRASGWPASCPPENWWPLTPPAGMAGIRPAHSRARSRAASKLSARPRA